MPSISADALIQGGAVLILGIVALMVFLGWLVPRWVVRQLERDRDYWRSACLKAMGHTDQLMPAAEITAEITQVLSDVAKRGK